MFDIVTIGSATRDNFLQGDYPLLKWPKAPLGKAYVLPFGEKLDTKRAFFTIGGNSVNASVTFARQGFRVACVGKIGNDIGGRELRERLLKEGVKEHFAVSSDRHTAFSVLILEKGDRTILGFHGASDTFTMKDFPTKELKAKWWYISLSGESDKMYPELVRLARTRNVRVAFNPSGYHIRHRRKEILASLRHIDVLLVNVEEAAELTNLSFRDPKRVFKKIDALMSPGIVVVTDGSRGVTVSDGRFLYKARTFKEKKLVDRTGAGDAFGSGFVSVLLSAPSFTPRVIENAIRLASANATSVVEHIGATEGAITKNEFRTSPRWKHFKISLTPIA